MRDNMDDLKNKTPLDDRNPMRVQEIPKKANERHVDKLLSEAKKNSGTSGGNEEDLEQLALDDDRRVKVLSPGTLVAKRFFRNRLAVLGLTMLVAMFLFSFVGGLISPYGEDEQFYTYTYMDKEYAGVVKNNDLRYLVADGADFGSIVQAQFLLAINQQKDAFSYKNIDYEVENVGTDLYTVSAGGEVLAAAYKDIINAAEGAEELSFTAKLAALTAYVTGEESFAADGVDYTLDEDGNIVSGGETLGYISRFVVSPADSSVSISRGFKEELQKAIDEDAEEFIYTDENGEESTYTITYKPATDSWSIIKSTVTYVYDRYHSPTKEHWLGTDTNGMDMLTRLMYGGRVSLVIGFIVVFIAAFLGVILGGIAGYFGKWVDNLIMRIVDVFYCIPSTPLIIIIGAAMDAMQVDPQIRMLYLMLILGFLSWPSIARLVRGQILSLREQEFMTATEACGISVRRRIFRHLIPNVIPQLIVTCTMSLGSTIITEATLSFLGLGVKFPFASWGNIINDVNNSYVMTNYWFIWIPAGICLLITVLGFNFVGDGLRDAFDPKMKR
ncbi:MAG: ABC transporter permease [Eubacteriales bacterium]|nr:ABC transporter permease [Eubacteriales bacterium]